jgi:type I restriction enzyme M protein
MPRPRRLPSILSGLRWALSIVSSSRTTATGCPSSRPSNCSSGWAVRGNRNATSRATDCDDFTGRRVRGGSIVVPDDVLFEGGAGETVRRKLLHECDVHTLLRLPTGVFYAQGVKANVLFFDRKPASDTPWTRELWVYDLRTNQHFTLKENPLRYEHLADFVDAYSAEDRSKRTESERFRRFTYDELVARDKASLDVFWLRDESLEDSENLPAPEVIAAEIVEDLEAALAQFEEIAASLSSSGEDAAR